MHLDHVAIAVRSIDSAAARLGPLLGYAPRTDRVSNTRELVNVVFLARPGSIDLKLIEPSSEDSPLWGWLRRQGEGLHHVCFRADDTTEMLQELAGRGLRVLADPAPGEAFDDHLIAFGYAGFGLERGVD